MLIELTLAIIFIATSISLLFFIPLIFGAPFEPSSDKRTETIIQLAENCKNKKSLDLGSGNGKLVFALASKGCEAHGYEINPWLVLYSKYKAKKLGLKNAHFHLANFWKKNFNKFDIITLFQMDFIMEKLEKKIKTECKKGTKIITTFAIMRTY